QIRQSFLDFFKSKAHTIVPSSSLLPDSPNLLFTNAGMNQFVPIFLGQKAADVSKWAGAVPGKDSRAADTQKCIRAGGKHNDLEDVGLDTYHHTFFEMLGNWSFGDYFKREAIEWAWELVAGVWKFPAARLYATVYAPDKSKGDPSEFDQEAYDYWAAKFRAAGLDPSVHIVNGGKKDNFWMMGDTGPCGPCSELHVDLTPMGDTKGRLVNQGSAECIEIWNLVFIQFNANPDGTFSPLPAKHVDTGMGFERVTGIIQNTQGFTDFTKVISNYETDIFRPLFDKLEKLSGKRYGSTLPSAGSTGATEQEKIDVAFRVIADHIRTLSFAIADGISPGNTDRNYVLRRILRRAVRYGRSLGLREPFFYKLTSVLADTMGNVFPEIRAQRDHVEEVIKREEEAFNKTLDKGIDLFEKEASRLLETSGIAPASGAADRAHAVGSSMAIDAARATDVSREGAGNSARGGRDPQDGGRAPRGSQISGAFAFRLYDEQGFPLDLTELMARERGLTVDVEGFNHLMEEQKARARAAQKKEIIELSQLQSTAPTKFVGYDSLEAEARVVEVVRVKTRSAVVLETSPFYAEMGGQVGDTGEFSSGGRLWHVGNTQKSGNTWLHFIEGEAPSGSELPSPGAAASLKVDRSRRRAIERHHTVTHLLHWALHEVVDENATQKGSYVGPEKLTFDFSSAPLSQQQIADVETLVNERILENAPVSWTEVSHAEVKGRKDVMQFFGEKYGDLVRVVQIGGRAGRLDGYSMELCGGTHTRATGELGAFRIIAESAVAAGIRRIEAVTGLEAYRQASEQARLMKTFAAKLNTPAQDLEKKIEALLAHQKELEKRLQAARQKEAAETARGLAARAQKMGTVPAIVENVGEADGEALQAMADALKGKFQGVVVLGGVANGSVSLAATVSSEFTKHFQAGKIINAIAAIVGGKGGGRPESARGGGKDIGKLLEALDAARKLLAGG
ncbi:MAG TPA: alanine--tRNA ligase, partial [Verrucomicrobiae bacterium]|nr:alanine--tRNA ligase [Verrucomicrobiae bacterium]